MQPVNKSQPQILQTMLHDVGLEAGLMLSRVELSSTCRI